MKSLKYMGIDVRVTTLLPFDQTDEDGNMETVDAVLIDNKTLWASADFVEQLEKELPRMPIFERGTLAGKIKPE